MTRRVAAALIVLLASTSAAWAQARWAPPYNRGVRAVEEQRWADAVRELNAAVRLADRQEAQKYVEGVVRIDYFPYVYLFIAHLQLGQLNEARVNLDKAMATRLPDRIAAVLAPHREEYDRRTAAKPAPPPIGPPPEPGRGKPTPPADPGRTTKPAATETESPFARELAAAEGLLGSRRYADALAAFERLERRFPGEYAKRQVSARRDEAARGRAAELVDEGEALLKGGRLADARARFQLAESTSAGAGRNGLAAVRAAEGAARAAKLAAAGDAAAAAGNYATAADRYRAALKDDPDLRAAREWLDRHDRYTSLVAKGTALFKEGKPEDARPLLADAERLHPERFRADKLPDLLAAIDAAARPAPEAQLAPVRAALTRYLDGDLSGTIAGLEPLAARSETLDEAVRAHVHAYLGVAYATRALLEPDADKRASDETRARESFTRAVAIRPDYQLPQLISPRIHDVLASVRKSRSPSN